MKKAKYFVAFISSLLILTGNLYAQTGPGGVGSSSNNILWLRANDLSLNNDDPVSTWTDQSGNGNNASQATSSRRPLFKTSQVNSLPALNFDGSNDRLLLSSHITTNAITVFGIYQTSFANGRTLLITQNHRVRHANQNLRSIFTNPISEVTVSSPASSFYSIFEYSTNQDSTSGTATIKAGSSTNSGSRTMLLGNSNSFIGANGGANYFRGNLSELIIYNEELNTASKNIVLTYLRGKYSRPIPVSLYSHLTSHPNGIIGIGQEADGANTSATGTGRITISGASDLDDGEYLLIGHDNAGFDSTNAVPSGFVQRWDQVYRADETGDLGTIDIVVDASGALLNGADFNESYVLLIDTVDGDFTNGGTTFFASTSENIGDLTLTFAGINLKDDAYFTLAEKVGEITSTQDGQWDEETTWDCGCIPTSENDVTIEDAVTIDSKSEADNLTISVGGSLSFSTDDTLTLNGDASINSSMNLTTGTIEANNPTFSQTFTNNFGTITINNLYVNNTQGLTLSRGTWNIDNSLRVSSGGLEINNATTMALKSDASSTAEILESMDNPYTIIGSGSIVLERFISARSANYSNMSSPIESATFQQIDDDLILSGLAGGDGNAVRKGTFQVFYSIWEYDPGNLALSPPDNTAADTIEDVEESMLSGMGYEVYLATVLGSFAGGTIDFNGTPNSGDVSVTIDRAGGDGFNLIGNPYQSHINYDNLDHTSLSNDFYIWNSSNGSYSTFSQGNNESIAPGQGFWVNKTSGTTSTFTFEEADKVSSNSSTFIRKGSNETELKLNIRALDSIHNQDLKIAFRAESENGIDEYDTRYLPSPLKEVPALISSPENNEINLIKNSLDNLSPTQIVPIKLISGISTDYVINTNNVEKVYENYDCVYLKDKVEGKQIDLTVDHQYTFSAEQGEFDRFELIVSKDYLSCEKILNGESNPIPNQNSTEKLALRNNLNGWWLDYNLSDDLSQQVEIHVYNLSGQEAVASKNLNLSGSGTEQLRQLQSLKGIYLIQIISEGEILNKKVQL